MSENPSIPSERRNFYGRVHGKTLRASQKQYLAEDLGRVRLAGVTVEENPARATLDPAALFGGRPVWLEVGFGGGEHLVHMAARYPDIGIIGCEPFVNGVAMLLGKIRAAGVENLAIHPGDVRDLFDVLPDACVDKAFLNYPDPWPKARHEGHRLFNKLFLDALYRTLAPGGVAHVATDHLPYFEQLSQIFAGDARFAPVAPYVPPEDEQTDFERYYVESKPIGRLSVRKT